MSALQPTGLEILDQLIDEVEGFGVKFTTATIAAGSVTTNDPRIVANVNSSGNAYVNQSLYVPTAAGADLVRSLDEGASVTSGVATLPHLGPATAVNGSPVTAYILGMHPSTVWNLINDGLSEEYFLQKQPLSLVPDPGFDDGVSNFGAGTNATIVTETTASLVFQGSASGKVVVTAADGFVPLGTAVPNPVNGLVFAAMISRLTSTGTARLMLTDGSGTEVESVTHTETAWTYSWLQANSSAETLLLRLGSPSSAATFYVDDLWLLYPQDRYMYLPSHANARYKIRSVERSGFAAMGSSSGTARAFSRETVKLGDRDFRYTEYDQDANPYAIEFSENVLRYPLWVTYERPFSDIDTITVGQDPTNCPQKQIVARCKLLLGMRHDTWPRLEAQARSEIRGIQEARKQREPKRTAFAGIRRP